VDFPIYGSVPPAAPAPGVFPPEYPDIDAYLADKCRKANRIFDGIVGALQNIAAFGTFNAITLAALLAVAIPAGVIFPPAMIPVAISVLLILTGSLFLVAQLASLLTQNRQDVVCILYEGDNTESVITLLADLIDILLASIPVVGTAAWALKSLFLLLANTDTINTLFDGSPVAGYADSTCLGCGDCSLVWPFDGGNDGWNNSSAAPACFGLAAPPAGTQSVNSSILSVFGVQDGNTYKAGLLLSGISWAVVSNTSFSASLRVLVAGGIYIDVVFLTASANCYWRTMSNSFPSQPEFNGLGVLLDDLVGETITDIFVYMSSNVGASGLTVEFDELGLYCLA